MNKHLAIQLLRAAARSLREGVATEREWSTVTRAIVVAQGLERRGIVRGLSGHLRSAADALQEIGRRAMDAGTWNATPLDLLELDVITTAIELHEYQLQLLSYGELRRVVERAEAEICSAGGRVVDVGQMRGVLA
ncbi:MULTISPECIES: hypothetical protein [unclassified Variovorax]|uniref:hypothetical protein n=1 Tax=unclassified Variovorax TaxID=663243 RepID=UPI003F47B91E